MPAPTRMSSHVTQNPENHVERPSGAPYDTMPEDDFPPAQMSAEGVAQDTNDDFPEIIDVVMEMGRDAEAPSPTGRTRTLLRTTHADVTSGTRQFNEPAFHHLEKCRWNGSIVAMFSIRWPNVGTGPDEAIAFRQNDP